MDTVLDVSILSILQNQKKIFTFSDRIETEKVIGSSKSHNTKAWCEVSRPSSYSYYQKRSRPRSLRPIYYEWRTYGRSSWSLKKNTEKIWSLCCINKSTQLLKQSMLLSRCFSCWLMINLEPRSRCTHWMVDTVRHQHCARVLHRRFARFCILLSILGKAFPADR